MASRIYRVLLLALCALLPAAAQPPLSEKAASLLKEWAAAPPEARGQVLERHAPFPKGLSREFWSTGELIQRKGDFDEALNRYYLSAAIGEREGDDLDAAIGLQLVGSVLRLRGAYDTSIEVYERSRAFAEKSGDRRRVSLIVSNLANVYFAQTRIPEALRLMEESLVIMPPDAPAMSSAPAHQNIAVIYALRGDYRRALEKFAAVLAIYEKAGNRTKVALTYQNLGVLQTKQGNYEAARAHLQRSLKIAEELDDPTQIAQSVNELGLAYTQEGNYPEAIQALERGKEIVDRMQLKMLMGDVRNNIALVYTRQGRVAEAIPLLKEAAAIFEGLQDDLNVARSVRGTSNALLDARDYAGALAAAERATALSKDFGEVEGEWQGRTLQARALQGLGRPGDAARELETAVRLIESQRLRIAGGDEERRRYFENATAPYYALIDLSLAAGRTFDALQYAERAKARILDEVLEHGPERVDQDLTQAERDEEQALRSEAAGIEAQLGRATAAERAALQKKRDDVRSRHTLFMTRLYARHPGLRVLRGAAPALDPGELSKLLTGPGDALVEYVTGDDRAWIFVVTRGAGGQARVDAWPIAASRDVLARRAEELRDAIARRDPGFRRHSRAMFDLLVKPAAARLAGKSRVWVVPDGPLWDMPFQTLTTTAGRYWIEDVTLSWAPSLTALSNLPERPAPASARLLAMGDPVRAGVERVAETSRQVQLVAAAFGESKAAAFTGAAATEEKFRQEAGEASIIHLATHGELDGRSPLYSRLVFSEPKQSGTGEDGYLEAWELMRLQLHARLAVLSACESGRGRAARGEGMIGLNWALLVAGVPTTVVSQWKVEAASSTALLTAFYRALGRQSGMAAALRSAALAVKADRRYEHPFYWAPFILVGRDSRL